MSFVLAPINSIRTSVVIVEPRDDDKTQQSEIKVRFKKLTLSQFKDLQSMVSDDESGMTWVEVLKDNIVDVEGLMDESKNPITYSSDVGDQLLDLQYVFAPMLEAFVAISTGERENERRKNLQKSGKRGR